MEWSMGTKRAETEAVSSVVVAVVGSAISFDAAVVISVVVTDTAATAGVEAGYRGWSNVKSTEPFRFFGGRCELGMGVG
jgi:hypothetical protein